MSEQNPIRVYVTHAFSESDDYLRVFEFLESVERFFYLNTSKPENVPEAGGMEAIQEELIGQIKQAEAMFVLASLYSEESDMVRWQMDVADANNIPTIAIRPFGGVAETAEDLVERAAAHIGWNDREMVDAVKLHARGEDTQRWETIEFTMDD